MANFEVYFGTGGVWQRVVLEGSVNETQTIIKNGADALRPSVIDATVSVIPVLRKTADDVLRPTITETAGVNAGGQSARAGTDILRPVLTEGTQIRVTVPIVTDTIRPTITETSVVYRYDPNVQNKTYGRGTYGTGVYGVGGSGGGGETAAGEFESTDFEDAAFETGVAVNTVPSAMRNVVYTWQGGDNNIGRLTAQLPDTDGGSPILGLRYGHDGGNGGTSPWIERVATTRLSYDFWHLLPLGTTYTLFVEAFNTNGTGPRTNIVVVSGQATP